MKNIISIFTKNAGKLPFFLLGLLFIGSSLQAQQWTGELNLGVGGIASRSVSQERLDSREDDPEVTNEAIPVIQFNFEYEEEDSSNSWFIGNEDPQTIEGGRKQLTPFGLVEISLFYTIPSTDWRDPYTTLTKQTLDGNTITLDGKTITIDEKTTTINGETVKVDKNTVTIGGKRKTTQLNESGASIGYTIEVGDERYLSAGYTLTRRDLDNDDTPDRSSKLGRDATETALSLTYAFGRWNVGYNFSRVNAVGIADSNRGHAFSGGYVHVFSRSIVLVNQASYQYAQYDHKHPLYEDEQITVDGSWSTILQYTGPYKQFYGFVYSAHDSNIDLFDSSTLLGFGGITWEF